MKTTLIRFDNKIIEDELQESLRPFFDHYNNLVNDLNSMISKLTINDLQTTRKTVTVNSGVPFVVGKVDQSVVVLTSTQKIDSYKVSKEVAGLTLNVDFKDAAQGELTLLVF